MNAEMFEEYLHFIANRRLNQIGLSDEYPGAEKPFPWMSEMMDLRKRKTSLKPALLNIKQVAL